MKTLLLLSGGLDSAVCLALQDRRDTHCLFINYGQTAAARERACSHGIAERCGAGWAEVWIPALPGADADGMIPGRNARLLEEATRLPAARILIGLNASDWRRPDASGGFLLEQEKRLQVPIRAPLLGLEKPQILAMARQLGIGPTDTWSCYGAGPEPCGTCGACRQRKTIEQCACPACAVLR